LLGLSFLNQALDVKAINISPFRKMPIAPDLVALIKRAKSADFDSTAKKDP
jgi:hypothetical protein